MTKNWKNKKRLLWVLNPQTTDYQSGMLTIIPNEQAVSERHRKAFTILQSWLTDSNWIQLIQLIKWIWYKIEKTRLTEFSADIGNLHNFVKLDLSKNALPYLQRKVTERLENLNRRSLRLKKSKVNLILENNSFKCICECLPLYFWLGKTSVTVHLLNSDLCTFHDGQTTKLRNVSTIVKNFKACVELLIELFWGMNSQFSLLST